SHNIHIFFFFFIDTATTEIYTLSLHDALPISGSGTRRGRRRRPCPRQGRKARPGDQGLQLGCAPDDPDHHGVGLFRARQREPPRDRKSTRLNSSHVAISYAVFCLKKKKQNKVI